MARLACRRVAHYADYVCGYETIEHGIRRSEPDAGIAAIEALVDALQPLDDVKTRTLRTAAHELRTPLTTAAGFVELLAQDELGPVTDGQRRALNALTRSVRRLTELVDALEPVGPGRVRERARP